MSNILFSSLKNEGPFILEWVAYHLSIGFDRIVIASNDCTDGSDDVLEALDAAGVVEHIPNPLIGNMAPQLQAEARARRQGKFANGDYVMWLDLDEFLVLPPDIGSVPRVIAEMQARGADGLLLNWRIMGDSGFDGCPRGFVVDRFTGASLSQFRLNRPVKTLFRYSDAIAQLHLHRPIWSTTSGEDTRLINGWGQVLDDEYLTKRFRDGSPKGGVIPPKGEAILGRVNHYSVRTQRVYELKKQRGRGFFDAAENRNKRHTDKFYERFNKNTCENSDILQYRDQTMDRMSALLTNADIRKAHAHTVAYTMQAIDQPVTRKAFVA